MDQANKGNRGTGEQRNKVNRKIKGNREEGKQGEQEEHF